MLLYDAPQALDDALRTLYGALQRSTNPLQTISEALERITHQSTLQHSTALYRAR